MTDIEIGVLSQMPPDKIIAFNPNDAKLQNILEALETSGYVKTYIDGSAEITPQGLIALAKAEKAKLFEQRQEDIISEQAAAQRAENERGIRKQRRHDWLVAIFSAIIGGLVTLIINKMLWG